MTASVRLCVFSRLRPAIIQQSVSFAAAALLFLSVHPGHAPWYSGQEGAVEAIVERRPQQQNQEAQNLQAVELLPAQRQAHHPDDQRAQAVQHHAGGGADLLSNTDSGEVKEGDADRVPQQSQQDQRFVSDLAEGV